ncbi:MAG TPA: Txe/YoeB family addiction module toxin [Longimicrobium sp.]|nr:Txe/YoeB family addiction module toxin [Longimicrobium sp.]
MSHGRRGSNGAHGPPAPRERKQQAILVPRFIDDLEFWTVSQSRVATRLARILRETVRTPFVGIGKPEPMEHGYGGYWSRRLTEADRIVYMVRDEGVYFYTGRSHYKP